MDEISLDSEILQQIIECFDESQNIYANHISIIEKIQTIVQNESNFFCYFIQILVTNLQQQPPKIRYAQLSIICIRLYFKSIDESQVDLFLSCIIPVLTNIITENIRPILSYAAILMSNIVENYGEEVISDFDSVLISLISDEKTIIAGLDAMLEISEKVSQYQIKVEHLQTLTKIFTEMPDSNLVSTFFIIVLNLLQSSLQENYIEFISTEILSFISSNFSKFQSAPLLNSMKIAIYFFEKTGDSELGDFIVYCIQNLDDLVFEGLEFFLNTFEESKDETAVPFHLGLIESLFDNLQSADEEDEKIDCPDDAQTILQIMSEEHGEPVVEAITELISKSDSTSQILRALCSIATELDDKEAFFQFAIDHLHDENRGNAALFLSRIFQPETASQIISELIPLVLDPDKIVLDKVHYSLETILQSDSKIKIEMNWIPPLFEAYTISVNEDDSNCANHLSKEIYFILNSIEKLNDEIYQSFFKCVYELFFCDEKKIFMFSASILLEILLKKLNVEYSQNIELISGRISESLQDSKSSLDSIYTRDQFFSLMICLIELYPDQITQHFVQPLFAMTQNFNTSIQNNFIIMISDLFWEFLVKVFKVIPSLLEETELMNSCIELALHEFHADQFGTKLDLISAFIALVLKSLDEETVDKIFAITVEIIQDKILSDFNNISSLLKEIIEFKEEKKSLLNEHVQFYKEFQAKIEKS